MQKINLHLGYLGQGMFIQLEPHTVNTQIEIFWVDIPIKASAVDTKSIVVGSLTSDKEEMSNKLVDQGLDNAPIPPTTQSQNRQASASFGS